MKCTKCDYYYDGLMFNRCGLIGAECFMPVNNCDLVNDDSSINYDSPYFKDAEDTK